MNIDAIKVIVEKTLGMEKLESNSDLLSNRVGVYRLVKLMQEIAMASGVSLPVTTIFQSRTLSDLARTINIGSALPFTPLIEMKAGRDDIPLFIVAGSGGIALELFPLARAINYPGAVYGCQARGLDGREQPHDTIEEMADYFLEAIRLVQPKGPYFLAGYSVGGAIALEIARRLMVKGEQVNFIGLIETALLISQWTSWKRTQYILGTLNRKLAVTQPDFMRVAAPSSLKRAKIFLRYVKRWITGVGERWTIESMDGLPSEIIYVHQKCIDAFALYRPQTLHCPVTFFTTSSSEPTYRFAPLVWQSYLPNLRVLNVEDSKSHHKLLYGKNLLRLAEHISDSLTVFC